MLYPKTIQRLHLASSSLLIIFLSLTICALLTSQMFAEKKRATETIRKRIIAGKTDTIKSIVNRTIQDLENDSALCEQTYASVAGQVIPPTQSGIAGPPISPCNETFLKELAKNRIRATRLPDNGYIRVNEILNYAGGKDYARRLVHPDLPKTEGMLLSTDMQDIKGNLPYLTELNGVNQDGEIVFDYWFKESDSDVIQHTLTFAKVYRKYNWIIATGANLNDIGQEIEAQTTEAIHLLRKQIQQVIILTAFLLMAALAIALFFHKRIKHTINYFQQTVEDREKQLQQLNASLDETVQSRTRELRESKTYLQSLLTAADNIAFIVFDQHQPHPLILDLSPGAEKIFGYSKQEAVGQPATLLLPADPSEENAKMLLAIQDSLKGYAGEAVLVRRNQEMFPALFKTSPRRDQSGRSIGLLGVFIDVSELRSTQEALRNSEKRYRKLFEEAIDGIILADKESGAIIDCNKAMAKLMGTTTKALLGSPLQLIFPTDHAEAGTTFPFTDRHISVDNHVLVAQLPTVLGKTLDIEITTSLFELQNTSCILGIVRDITDKKHLNERLQQAQKMEAIGTLAGGIAHDFNNILSAIMGFTELAIESLPPDTEAKNNLKQVLKASQRAANLVEQILAFSRKTSQERIHFQPVPLVKEALKLLRSTLPTTIHIQQDVHPTEVTIFANPTQYHQVFMNLCSNAYQAMEHTGGQLSVSLKQVQYDATEFPEESHLAQKELLKLSVSDTGPGIPKAIQQRIFDPFFTTKEPGQGTGLGLSTVHGIVKDIGGAVRVISSPGKGSTFEIVLPISNRQQSPAEIVPEPERYPTGTARILFIDDEPGLTTLGKKIMESLGYTVTCCNSASEALLMFNAAPDRYDLIITDYTMPDLTGIELAKSILARFPEMPIILCTGYSSGASKEVAEQHGIREFIMKPFSKREIAELIDNVLNRPKEEPTPQ